MAARRQCLLSGPGQGEMPADSGSFSQGPRRLGRGCGVIIQEGAGQGGERNWNGVPPPTLHVPQLLLLPGSPAPVTTPLYDPELAPYPYLAIHNPSCQFLSVGPHQGVLSTAVLTRLVLRASLGSRYYMTHIV